jgi:hypothetical protein
MEMRPTQAVKLSFSVFIGQIPYNLYVLKASEMTLGFRTRLIQRHTAGSILVTCRLRCQPALHLDQLLIWFRLDSMHLCGDINLGPAYRVVQKV